MTAIRLLITICVAGILALPLWNLAHAAPVGNECCGGIALPFWSGDVDGVIGGEVYVLGDHEYTISYVYILSRIDPGQYFIDFEFQSALSDEPHPHNAPPFAFLDTFYAGLLFRNDNEPGLVGYYDWKLLFGLDTSTDINGMVNVTPSTDRPDWSHFRMAFENTHSYVAPGFILLDLNFIDDDSEVYIADVCISQIPIPSSILLVGSGLVGLMGLSRRKRGTPFVKGKNGSLR